MAELLSEEEATGKAKEIYDEIKTQFKMVPKKRINRRDEIVLQVQERRLQGQNREKEIMLKDGFLDRKTKELIAMAVSQANSNEYCSLAHEATSLAAGASEQEVNEVKKIVELYASFNAIAYSLRIPVDLTPDMMKGKK
jgi:AhpD family alkylhydroperoxidase